MASKFCCTAAQEGRSSSPEMFNARVSIRTSPQLPLLPNQATSPNSHFTSTQSEDLNELRHIFEDAEDHAEECASPSRNPRARHSRASIISLHSLHKMTSMRSFIRKKFLKELPKKDSKVTLYQHKGKTASTVIKHSNECLKHQLKVTKEDLRKDLLSDKKPDDGGYDVDAEVLSRIANNIEKKTPSKRPSIHSIDWVTSTGSKSISGSSPMRHDSRKHKGDIRPSQIQSPQTLSLSSRIAQVFSTPNLRVDNRSERDRTLQRSHSVNSIKLPKTSPFSPLRLSSLGSSDKDGMSWTEVMSESFRLSHLPLAPSRGSPKASKTPSPVNPTVDKSLLSHDTEYPYLDKQSPEPMGTSASRTSIPVRGGLRDHTLSINNPNIEDLKDDHEENPRRSVHLYSMRISHHLRSGSLLSWDQLADTHELPSPSRSLRQRPTSDHGRHSCTQRHPSRHERQTSSSGFASSKVPSRWGKVLPNDRGLRGDIASSIYSSRPQSPPQSFGDSMANLARSGMTRRNFSHSSISLRGRRRSNSFPNHSEQVRQLPQQYLISTQEPTADAVLLSVPVSLSRKNSVAETKKSRFREEFSPSPPKKRITSSKSIMKLLTTKRVNMRSQSEANLRPHAPDLVLDGHSNTLPVAEANREHRQSRSLLSLQVEQEALGKNKGVYHVWDQALKAHQEERESMFLPRNRDLAVHASPFRERSGSVSVKRASVQEDVGSITGATNTPKQSIVPILTPGMFNNEDRDQALLVSRRSVTAGRGELSLEQEIVDAFENQNDDAAIIGAWGRYPSHTRIGRTLSAGIKDHVETRDFALEAAVRFASTKYEHYGHDDLIDPTEPMLSPPLLPGAYKRKRKVGGSKMAKSHSMTFGKNLIKNYYSSMFKSSSAEFRQHGRGHRSSIASGGTLEHPELELLPEIFMSGGADGIGVSQQHLGDKQVVRHHSERHRDGNPESTLSDGDSTIKLRPRRNSSAPNLGHLLGLQNGATDSEHAQDRARVWSIYYKTCVPSFPRMSSEADFALQDAGDLARVSSNSKGVSMRSRTIPSRLTKSSRNASRMSQRSAQPSFLSVGADGIPGEGRSLVSVRHSTMDLISKFKEQEIMEREHVLSMTRAESRPEGA